MSVNLFKNGTLTKIARGFKDTVVTITNNLLATEPGTVLDAVQGKMLDYKITEVNNSVIELDNSKADKSEINSVKESISLLKTESGHSLELNIDENYIMTISLLNKSGETISSKAINFPVESMVVNASYSSGKLTLILQNGNTVDVDVSAIVKGLVNESRTIAGIDLKDDITADELIAALGIDTIKEDVAQLKGDLANVFKIVVSRNILDESLIINGEFVNIDGTHISNSSFCRTPLIDISGNNGYISVLTYTVGYPNVAGASFHRGVFRDNDLNVISYINNGTTNGNVASGLLSVPEDAKFFECGFTADANTTHMVAFSDSTNVIYDTYSVKYITPDYVESNIKSFFNGKKLITIGDSITAQNRWQPYVVDGLGISTHYNHGYSGNQSWQIDTDERIATWEDDADLVLVMVGTNDWAMNNNLGEVGYEENYNFSGNIYVFIQKIMTKYPNKTVVFMGCPYGLLPNADGFTDGGRKNQIGLSTLDYSNRTKDVCRFYGIPFIDNCNIGWNKFNVSNYIQDDGGWLHPNELGAKLLGQHILGELKKMYPNINN